jgi:hypothetical protein
MKYLICVNTLDKTPEIEITADEYTELENARRILLNAQAIEIKYDILITNFLEFEKQLLNNTATFMVRVSAEYNDLFEIRQNLNIRVVNLHTSGKLYKDQLNQNVTKCVPEILHIKETIKELFDKESLENIEYRFIELLRDHVQHTGLPVHWIQLNLNRIPSDEDGLLEFNLELGLELSQLKEDRLYKKCNLNGLGENINLKSAIRSYIESISKVHESARSIIANSVTKARELIEKIHFHYRPIYNGSLSGLCAMKKTDLGQFTSIPLLLDWDNIRLELQKRNKTLPNLKKCYVTGIIKVRS